MAANSVVSCPIWPKFELIRDFMHVLVTFKYKNFFFFKGLDKKPPRKGGEIIFTIISQWGLSVATETRVLIQSAPKPYAATFPPTPMMLPIKFDQDLPTGFRDIQVQKCEIFVPQGQVTPKWMAWFGPKSNLTKLLCLSWLPATLMMIWSKMNKLAWRHHFPIVSLWELF